MIQVIVAHSDKNMIRDKHQAFFLACSGVFIITVLGSVPQCAGTMM